MGGVAGGDGAARAVSADAALDGGGVGMAHVEASGGETERLAEDLSEHGLEPRTHRRGAGVDHQGAVRARLHLRGLEGTEAGLLHVDGHPDSSTWP